MSHVVSLRWRWKGDIPPDDALRQLSVRWRHRTQQAGISKSTLSRLIKQGKVSAERQENGTLHIDASELDRLADIRATMHRSGNVSAQQSDTPKETVLQREVEPLRELLHDKERTIEDLRQERDAWRGQAERLSLTAAKPERPEKPKGWWRRWWDGD